MFTEADIAALTERARKNPAALMELTEQEQAEAARAIFRIQDEKYAKDAWQWAIDHVLTVDEAGNQILPFPDKAYLHDLFDAMGQEKKLAIPKSRRMTITWAVSIFALHRVRFRKNFAAFIQSETESKAAFVVDRRCKFVEDHISPLYRRPYGVIRGVGGLATKLNYSQGSSIWGVAQGADVFRTYTPSLVVMDEVEFQEQGHQSFVAVLPFLEKEAQVILISTSNGPHGVLADMARSIGFTRYQ